MNFDTPQISSLFKLLDDNTGLEKMGATQSVSNWEKSELTPKTVLL